MNLAAATASYATAAVVFVALDAVWLRFIAIDWYTKGLGHLMAPQVNLLAAAVFYLLFPLAITVLAVVPAHTSTWTRGAFLGAVLGLAAYATYDLTNLSTLKDWPLGLSLIDMAWGTVLSATAAVAGRAAWLAVDH